MNLTELSNVLGINLDWFVDKKMQYNETRKEKHGKAY